MKKLLLLSILSVIFLVKESKASELEPTAKAESKAFTTINILNAGIGSAFDWGYFRYAIKYNAPLASALQDTLVYVTNIDDSIAKVIPFSTFISMIGSGYVKVIDTMPMLSTYLRKTDTTGKFVSNQYGGKLSIHGGEKLGVDTVLVNAIKIKSTATIFNGTFSATSNLPGINLRRDNNINGFGVAFGTLGSHETYTWNLGLDGSGGAFSIQNLSYGGARKDFHIDSVDGKIHTAWLDEYDNNISSSYTARSKVDKNYVDSVSGAVSGVYWTRNTSNPAAPFLTTTSIGDAVQISSSESTTLTVSNTGGGLALNANGNISGNTIVSTINQTSSDNSDSVSTNIVRFRSYANTYSLTGLKTNTTSNLMGQDSANNFLFVNRDISGSTNFWLANGNSTQKYVSYNGNLKAMTAKTTDQVLGSFSMAGYDGSTGFQPSTYFGVDLLGVAEENQTTSNHGSNWRFRTASLGSATLSEKMRISANGNVLIGTGTTPSNTNTLLTVATGKSVQFDSLNVSSQITTGSETITGNAVIAGGTLQLGTGSTAAFTSFYNAGGWSISDPVNNYSAQAGPSSISVTNIGAGTSTVIDSNSISRQNGGFKHKVQFSKQPLSANITDTLRAIPGTVALLSDIATAKHTVFTPTTGSTINLTNNAINIVNPAGAILALTINLPSSPADGSVVFIKFTQAVTTVTYSGGSVSDGLLSPAAGGMSMLTYDSATTTWY